MRRRYMISGLVVMVVSLLIGLSIAYTQDSLSIDIDKKADLVNDGQAVNLTVEIACPSGRQVLEAFAYVVQDDNQSNFGGIPLTCDGVLREYVVQIAVSPDSPLFHRGRARATAFVLLLDPATGATESGEDSQRIKLR